MKEKSLLRRYRWPLFILLWGAGQFSGTMFLYGQTKEAGVGFVIALGIICVAVVLEMIDETRERNESRRRDEKRTERGKTSHDIAGLPQTE